MSVRDLPARLERYGGDHITIKRIAVVSGQLAASLSFPASEKRKDPRYKWFVENYGERCWEIDAVDPNVLRDLVEQEISACILDRDQWQRDAHQNEAERESLREGLNAWAASFEDEP
jgi:hypothetical protein